MLNKDYGVTPTGFVKKRLDEIEGEIHDALSAGWHVDTRANPKSYLNTLVTNFADKIAEIWEVAEQVYQNLYPSTAEGEALDRVAQFGGIRREPSRPAAYTILCTGDNETVIPTETVIETETSPAIPLMKQVEETISIEHCTEATFEVVGNVNSNSEYWINIDDTYFFNVIYSSEDTDRKPLYDLYDKLTAEPGRLPEGMADIVSDDDANELTIVFADVEAHSVRVKETLNAKSVTSPLTFLTVGEGDIVIPEGAVTKIRTSVSGLKSVSNKKDYIAGRARETDFELRNSYSKKIFIRSRTMLDSITSAILANVEGVVSVSAYQNDTNKWRGIPITSDVKHMPPHSVEVVVEGGDDHAIAEQIFATKAAGIQTCHHCGYSTYIPASDQERDTMPCCAVGTESYALIENAYRIEHNGKGLYCIDEEVEDDYGYLVPVHFSRPWEVKFSVTVKPTANIAEFPGTNAQEKIKEIIKENINSLSPGENIQPQKWIHKLYEAIPGISNYEITISDLSFPSGDNNHADGEAISHGIGYNEVARVEDTAIIVDWQI